MQQGNFAVSGLSWQEDDAVNEKSFVEKMLYRLIRKHIAGTTMSSALSKAKELNKKNMLASITYLSSAIENKSKAKYITTTYKELIHRIARLGIKANVQIPLEQVGALLSPDAAMENIAEILDTGNKYGVFVWAEVNGAHMPIVKKLGSQKGFGIAVPEKDIEHYLKKGGTGIIKVMFDEEQRHAHEGKKSIPIYIDSLVGRSSNVVLSSMPEGMLWKIIRGSSNYKKSVVFEFKMGYSNKKLIRLIKSGARISVSVPFGKDWTGYAMTNVPEGYMRFLANSLLGSRKEKGI